MSRLLALDPAAAGAAKPTLDAVGKALGLVPNLYRVAANSTATLSALVSLNGALAKGDLNARVREQIALAVAQQNGCDYCLSAHTVLGGLAGLAPDSIDAARDGHAADAKTQAILTLTTDIVRSRGNVDAAAVDAAKTAGVNDAEIMEIVGNVALNIFTNYLNLVAETTIDFPAVRSARTAAA